MTANDLKRIAKHFDTALLAGLLVLTWLATRNVPLRVDEFAHRYQMQLLADGIYVLDPRLTQIPGYHWLIAQLMRLAHSDSVAFLRGLTVLFGAGCIMLFARCQRLLADGPQRISQFALCPIIFPYFFLIYTDIPSLVLILAGVWLGLERRYVVCALVLTLSLAVRQDNVIWLLAIPAVTWLQQTGNVYSWRNVQAFLRANWLLGVGLLAFVAFVAINRGVAVGDRGAHPFPVLFTGNVFFMLFIYALVFLPLVLSRAPNNLRATLGSAWSGPLFALFFAIYLFTFSNTHPYNNFLEPQYFLHNAVLMAVAGSLWLKLLFFVPVSLAAADLGHSMCERPILIPIVAASIVFLFPHWLIEHRYYIVSFALLLLFRPEGSRRAEQLTTLLCAALSVGIVYGFKHDLFLL